MKQKSGPGKAPAERTFGARPAGSIQLKGISASCRKGCAVRRTSPSFAAAKARKVPILGRKR
jgi:hypothetical protein